MESTSNWVSRRSVVGGAALGVTALVLPTAAHAVSSITAEWIEAQPDVINSPGRIYFLKVGSGQLGVNWIRAENETPFTYNVSIRASDVPVGRTAPTTQPVVYYGLSTSAPDNWPFADYIGRYVVAMWPDVWADLTSPTLYSANVNSSITGTTFEATFTSVTGIVATVVRTVVW